MLVATTLRVIVIDETILCLQLFCPLSRNEIHGNGMKVRKYVCGLFAKKACLKTMKSANKSYNNKNLKKSELD